MRERWNDYGIGLLLQGDLKGAEAAFLKVTRMEPGYADGWVNVGRARLQEGNLAGAEESLRKALELDPEASPRPTSSSAPPSSSRAATTRRSGTCARRRRSTRATAWCATRSAGCCS